jgi:hypothetical protein
MLGTLHPVWGVLSVATLAVPKKPLVRSVGTPAPSVVTPVTSVATPVSIP